MKYKIYVWIRPKGNDRTSIRRPHRTHLRGPKEQAPVALEYECMNYRFEGNWLVMVDASPKGHKPTFSIALPSQGIEDIHIERISV